MKITKGKGFTLTKIGPGTHLRNHSYLLMGISDDEHGEPITIALSYENVLFLRDKCLALVGAVQHPPKPKEPPEEPEEEVPF